MLRYLVHNIENRRGSQKINGNRLTDCNTGVMLYTTKTMVKNENYFMIKGERHENNTHS